MFGFYDTGGLPLDFYFTMNSILIFPFAVLFCGFIQNWTIKLFSFKAFDKIKSKKWVFNLLFFSEVVCLFALYGLVILMLANNTYNPFIYFQF